MNVAARVQEPNLADQVGLCLGKYLSSIMVGSLLESTCGRLGIRTQALSSRELPAVIDALERSLALYLDPADMVGAVKQLRVMMTQSSDTNGDQRGYRLSIVGELDIRESRTTAFQLAKAVGFDLPDATKVATVVSELARNILRYAVEGIICLEVVKRPRPGIRITAKDDGPGIRDLDSILSGTYESRSGLGLGLRGSRQMVDQFDIASFPGQGTKVVATKFC